MPILFVGLGLLAAFAGVHYGRRHSAIAIAICVATVIAASLVAGLLLGQADQHAWQLEEGHPWSVAFGLGILALCTGLGFVGPALFSRRWVALTVSAVLLVGVGATQLPLLYVGCTLFGACP